MKYLIMSYMVGYRDGSRDIVKLIPPKAVEDLELFRATLKRDYNCAFINLNYTEYGNDDE